MLGARNAGSSRCATAHIGRLNALTSLLFDGLTLPSSAMHSLASLSIGSPPHALTVALVACKRPPVATSHWLVTAGNHRAEPPRLPHQPRVSRPHRVQWQRAPEALPAFSADQCEGVDADAR